MTGKGFKPAVDEELSSSPGKLVFPGTVLT